MRTMTKCTTCGLIITTIIALLVSFTMPSFSQQADTTGLNALFQLDKQKSQELYEKNLNDYKQRLLARITELNLGLVQKNWTFIADMFDKKNEATQNWLSRHQGILGEVKICINLIDYINLYGERNYSEKDGYFFSVSINGFSQKPTFSISAITSTHWIENLEKIEDNLIEMEILKDLNKQDFVDSLKANLRRNIISK